MVTNKDTFTKTTREIAEYLSCEYDDVGKFRTGMVDMQLPELVEPVPPADPGNVVAIELWKLLRRTYGKKSEIRRKNSERVYALVLGQCSQALRNRMEAHDDWECINTDSNVMELLEPIQTCMMQQQTRRYSIHTLYAGTSQVYAFCQ
jgi:hypothetical protein